MQKVCLCTKKGDAMKLANLRPLGKYSRMVLHIELPITLGAALFFLFSYLAKRTTAPVFAAREYAPLVPYLLFPLIITAFSVLLIERLTMEE
jgi:predicted membrane-bound mannosyltransferase